MKQLENLLAKRNKKTGNVNVFNLQSYDTCPGKTSYCEKTCYAHKGNYCFNVVINKYARNLSATLRPDFIQRICNELALSKSKIVRVHSSGDFYSLDYLAKWIKIAGYCKDNVFYAYTRCWHLNEYKKLLNQFEALPNVVLWKSIDPSDKVLPSGRLAFIEGSKGACKPNCQAQLKDNVTCDTCRICFSKAAKKVCFKKH